MISKFYITRSIKEYQDGSYDEEFAHYENGGWSGKMSLPRFAIFIAHYYVRTECAARFDIHDVTREAFKDKNLEYLAGDPLISVLPKGQIITRLNRANTISAENARTLTDMIARAITKIKN